MSLRRCSIHMQISFQASWVCQCDYGMVQRLEADFKVTLQQQNSLEDWAAWLKGVVTQALKPHEEKPTFAKAARQFLLKWSFYRYILFFVMLQQIFSQLNLYIMSSIVRWLSGISL